MLNVAYARFFYPLIYAVVMTDEGSFERSCIDCNASGCDRDGKAPGFCLTTNCDTDRAGMLSLYSEEDLRMMRTAAGIESDGYMRWCRVTEVIEFCTRMGYRRIGIATCAGLISESKTFAKMLRNHGFEVLGVCCKVGMVPKPEFGIDESCCSVGANSCNPVYQAEELNRWGSEFNVVIGLCVGHDSLFIKHSEAPVTVLVVKDRVMAHNPVGALYSAYQKNL